jgi:His/Glu/Gln/Arg/opine family amino acid ABC transporter permease subunit
MYDFRFDVVWEYLPYLAKGVWVTLYVTFASTAIGLVLGVLIAVLRLSKNPFLSLPMRGYIEFFRNTPTLVKLVWVFYLIPIFLGLQTDAVTSCIIAMAVSAAAYIAEVVRAGIQDVPRGDIEAAEAIGMRPVTVLRRIILPQALRKVLPPLANTFIVFLKYSSLISVVGVNDLMYRANVISTTTFRPIETYTVLALFYFVLCYGLSKLFSTVEGRMAVDV